MELALSICPEPLLQSGQYLIYDALKKIEALYPHELNLATGRLLTILAQCPDGFEKNQLLKLYYPDFGEASFQRQLSLEVCLNKIIQRARARYQLFGVDIHFCKRSRRWRIYISINNENESQSKLYLAGHKFRAI